MLLHPVGHVAFRTDVSSSVMFFRFPFPLFLAIGSWLWGLHSGRRQLLLWQGHSSAGRPSATHTVLTGDTEPMRGGGAAATAELSREVPQQPFTSSLMPPENAVSDNGFIGGCRCKSLSRSSPLLADSSAGKRITDSELELLADPKTGQLRSR